LEHCVHLTHDVLAALIEANPRGMAACRKLGQSPAQIALEGIKELAGRPQRVRDAMFRTLTHELGIYGVNTERQLGEFIEGLGARYSGEVQRIEDLPFSAKLDRHEQARYFAEQSTHTPTTWSPESIEHVARTAAKATLTNGLARKLARGDGERTAGVLPEHRADWQDRNHRRALIAGGLDREAKRERPARYEGKTADSADLGDMVAFAFDLHDVHGQLDDATRDTAEELRDFSNAIVTRD